MQCLYCEAELKPFRGLFDEDFCCREHRDKYLSSFRKSLTRLPSEPTEGEKTSATRLADFREIEVRPVPVPAAHRKVPAKPFMAQSAIEVSALKPPDRDPLPPEERPAGLIELVPAASHAFVPLPLDLPPAPPVAPRFLASDDGSALLPMIDFVDDVLPCCRLASTSVAASNVALRHQLEIPAFQVSPAAMQTDLEIESTPELSEESAASTETAPGAGPATVAGLAPVDCPPPLAAASSSEAPASMAGQPAPIRVPALASGMNSQPGLAPEMVANISHEQAANPTAAPHTHGALQPSFWSSVRIKKWRLRITFAKPA